MEPAFIITACTPFIIVAAVVLLSQIIVWIRQQWSMPRMALVTTAWCAGCDRIVHSDWMKFTDEGLYRCDVCRGERNSVPMIVNVRPIVRDTVDGIEYVAVNTGGLTTIMSAADYQRRYTDV